MSQFALASDKAVSRVVITCAVVGVHAFSIALLFAARREPDVTGHEKYFDWIPLIQTPTQARPDLIGPKYRTEMREQVQIPAPTLSTSPSASSSVEPENRASWHDQGTFYARRAVEEATTDRYLNLGPRKSVVSPASEAPTLFGPDKRVFGDTGEDAMGDPIVKVSENCYRELSKTVNTAKDYVEMAAVTKLSPPMLKCMFSAGSSEPRGDLFDHLKKDRQPPKVAGASDLPERIGQQSER